LGLVREERVGAQHGDPAVRQQQRLGVVVAAVTTRKDGRRVVYALRHGHLRRLVDEALSVADHQIGELPPHD
ncbi:hypothetical protein ACWDCZ_34515, partial [Kitasatospora sp. NPDC001225]